MMDILKKCNIIDLVIDLILNGSGTTKWGEGDTH